MSTIESLEAKIAELVATRDHRIQAEKLALAGQLAAAVAHEVNNPLAVVRANLEELRALAVDEQMAELVAETLRGVDRISELVAGFRRLATPLKQRTPERLEILDVVRECVAALPDARVRLLAAAEPTFSVVARDDLRAALINVMAYLTRPGGSRAEGERLIVSLSREQGRPCIAIVDRTLTLSEDERRRCFDPRVEVDTRHGRTMRLNIALALSFQLLHRNGAELSVVADPDGGTAFRVLLPSSP